MATAPVSLWTKLTDWVTNTAHNPNSSIINLPLAVVGLFYAAMGGLLTVGSIVGEDALAGGPRVTDYAFLLILTGLTGAGIALVAGMTNRLRALVAVLACAAVATIGHILETTAAPVYQFHPPTTADHLIFIGLLLPPVALATAAYLLSRRSAR